MTERKTLAFAYERYLQTGNIPGMWEGAKIQGSGPPKNPLTYEQFDKAVRAIPKPPPKVEEPHVWPTEAEKARCAEILRAVNANAKGTVEQKRSPFPDVSRTAFRDFQRRNPDIHGNPLSYVSRRMTGEHNE